MRIVVTGASGFIGGCLMREPAGMELRGLCFRREVPGLLALDLRDTAAFRALLREYRPDAVVHAAARPSVDWCEEHPAEARTLNLDVPLRLAEACAGVEAALAFISTDYVFDGAAGPYAESAAPRPVNVYGRLKLEAERGIQQRLTRSLVVRTTNVYGYDPTSRNFLMGVLPRAARGETVALAEDQWGTPTLVEDLCAVLIELLLQGAWGTFHVTGPDFVDRLEWARAAARAFGVDPRRFVGLQTSELAQAAPRPLRAGLRSERLPVALSGRLRGLEAGLAAMRSRWGGAPPVAAWDV